LDALMFQTRDFRPAPWAPGPHFQTLGARVLRPSDSPFVRRERLTTPDEDFLDLDWTADPGPDAPVVLVMHGLEGSAQRRYMRNVCREINRAGMLAVALNFRGCSGEPNKAPHYYHSGKTDDPELVLTTLRERFPGRRVGALGFSLGGNVLLKLLGERSDGGRGLVDAAVAISVPYDLAAGCDLLERSLMGRFYSSYFLRSLQSKLRLKDQVLRKIVDLEAAIRARTIREFDDRVTALLHGFGSAAEYYADSSSIRYLEGVLVPTLMLHAVDDPFLPADFIPDDEAGANPHLHLALQPLGGHVGFLEGSPRNPSFWAEEEGARFLAELLGARAPESGASTAGEARGI
jgi:predicted alpha/beta-fold hydrolase